MSWLLAFALNISVGHSELIDSHAHLQLLSHDELNGRKSDSIGNQLAAHYIASQFKLAGLQPFNHHFNSGFTYRSGFTGTRNGQNIVAQTSYIPGQPYVVITAHFDHLGAHGSRIFNGADDNASGVAAMLSLAKMIEKSTERKLNYLFVATDAEEAGLHGAKALLENFPIPINNVLLNINLDMLAGGKKKLLALYSNELKPFVAKAKTHLADTNYQIRFTRGQGFFPRSVKNQRQRILNAGDHRLFYKNDIPILYFGVGEHKYYHTPKDTYENINSAFFDQNIMVISYVLNLLEQHYHVVDKT